MRGLLYVHEQPDGSIALEPSHGPSRLQYPEWAAGYAFQATLATLGLGFAVEQRGVMSRFVVTGDVQTAVDSRQALADNAGSIAAKAAGLLHPHTERAILDGSQERYRRCIEEIATVQLVDWAPQIGLQFLAGAIAEKFVQETSTEGAQVHLNDHAPWLAAPVSPATSEQPAALSIVETVQDLPGILADDMLELAV